MALSTAKDFIRMAMRKNGALTQGRQPSAAESADFLESLNLLYREWSKYPGLRYAQFLRSFTWPASVASRTIGPTGADFTNSRIQKIINAQFVDTAGGVTYPVDIISEENYNNIEIKSNEGIPFWLCYKYSLTNGTLFPYYIPPTAMQLNLATMEPFPEYASVNDPVGLPIEYHTAIVYNLALGIASDLGVTPTREIILTANESLTSLKALKLTPPPIVLVAAPLRRGRTFNIFSGGFA